MSLSTKVSFLHFKGAYFEIGVCPYYCCAFEFNFWHVVDIVLIFRDDEWAYDNILNMHKNYASPRQRFSRLIRVEKDEQTVHTQVKQSNLCLESRKMDN